MDTNGDGIYDVFSQLVGPLVTFQPAPGTICNENLPGLPAGSICAINSAFDIDGGPWANFSRGSQADPVVCLAPNGFTEIALNLSVIGFGNTECISSFNAKTRTSQSITSELKDFALFAFDTDNTPPEISLDKPKVTRDQVRFGFRVEDRRSLVYRVWYAVDGGPWQVIHPEDGIYDALDETFALEQTDLASGEHTLVVQATDDSNNAGTGKISFVIP